MSDLLPPSEVPAVSIRPVTPDDLEAILGIESRVHLAPWSKGNFEAEWEKPYSSTWVLTDDETDSRVFGYVVFWTMGESAEILNIAVDPDSRGLGFAKKMLHHVVREAVRISAKKLILDVRKSNLAAVSLYQGAGFAISQVRKGFYSNGEDAYHMVLAVEGEIHPL